ncbi:predicted protein [Postia placenta Mad-698-R]|nr:predicted protein [Postia placenta Mad-698-R]
MSLSSMDEAQLIQSYQYSVIGEYIDIVAMCLFVYDSVISFNLEWRAVWSRKITGATALYLALRYVTLLNIIMFVIEFTITSCAGYYISHLVYISTGCGTYLAQAAFVSIRVYAIDNRRWTKAAIVMMLGLVPVAINISCNLGFSYSTFENNILLLITRICILMLNLLVVISTWQATRANQGVTAWSSRGSLMAVLFRDGTVHFALVVGLNAANIAVTLLLGASTIHATIYNHSAVSVQEYLDISGPTELSSHASSFSSFASRIIGNLGEMLEGDTQAPNDDFEGDLNGLNDAVEINMARDLDDCEKPPSGTNKAQTGTTTTAVCKQATGEGGTANRELPEAPDEDFHQRVTKFV